MAILLVSHDSRDAMLRSEAVAQYEFEVSLAGHMVGCKSLVDAVAIKTASDILTGEDPTPYSPEQLKPIVAVLLRYGFCRMAELLG
jgi:hypothetical protein